MVSRIDIAMVPSEAAAFPGADAFVVIDALRATTTISALFSRGLRQLRVVTDTEAAKAARGRTETLLFGEIGGLRPEGFDYGNSPAEAATLDVRGRDAVLMTSNGTKALCSVAALGPTVAGAMVNMSSVVQWASGAKHLVLVCAGNHGARVFSLEDFAVAAAITRILVAHHPEAGLGDAALLATTGDLPEDLIKSAEHAAVTRSLGFGSDVEFACVQDVAPSLPTVIDHGAGWAVLENRLTA